MNWVTKSFVLGIAVVLACGTGCRSLGRSAPRPHIELVFEIDTSKLSLTQAAGLSRLQSEARQVLQRRVLDRFGVAVARLRGKNQIVVDLNKDVDFNLAERELATPGKLGLYWAKNVVGPRSPYATYDIAAQLPGTEPSVRFIRRHENGKNIAYWLPPSDPAHPENRTLNPEYQEIIRAWGPPVLEAADFENASLDPDGKEVQPVLYFTKKGSDKIEKWSRSHPEMNLAIVLDGRVLSVNPLAPGTVLRDNARIMGHMERDFVLALVAEVRSGELPVELKLVSATKFP